MSTKNNIKTTEDEKEKVRRNLLERYLSTGKVGLIKPKSTDEAIDLIETVVDMYVDVPKNNSNSNNDDIVEDTLDTLDPLANNSIVYDENDEDENDEDENDEDEEGELEAEDTSYTSYTSYTLTLSQMSEKLKNILADI